MNDPAMNEALKSYDLFFMNKDEIRMYVNRQMARMDYETAMSEREAEGIKKGINLDMLKDALGLSDEDLSVMAAKNSEIKQFLA